MRRRREDGSEGGRKRVSCPGPLSPSRSAQAEHQIFSLNNAKCDETGSFETCILDGLEGGRDGGKDSEGGRSVPKERGGSVQKESRRIHSRYLGCLSSAKGLGTQADQHAR
eukprot:2211477-Rhodomonas_salina.3